MNRIADALTEHLQCVLLDLHKLGLVRWRAFGGPAVKAEGVNNPDYVCGFFSLIHDAP